MLSRIYVYRLLFVIGIPMFIIGMALFTAISIKSMRRRPLSRAASVKSADTLKSAESAETWKSSGSDATWKSARSDATLKSAGSDASWKSAGSDATLKRSSSMESVNSVDSMEKWKSVDKLKPVTDNLMSMKELNVVYNSIEMQRKISLEHLTDFLKTKASLEIELREMGPDLRGYIKFSNVIPAENTQAYKRYVLNRKIQENNMEIEAIGELIDDRLYERRNLLNYVRLHEERLETKRKNLPSVDDWPW